MDGNAFKLEYLFTELTGLIGKQKSSTIYTGILSLGYYNFWDTKTCPWCFFLFVRCLMVDR